MSETVKRYWWCRNGMVDEESGDGMLRLKTVSPESFVPSDTYNRDIKALEDEGNELQASFDLRWKADMRAVDMWHEAGGDELTWPDHADLCVWLMEQNSEQDKAIAQLRHDRDVLAENLHDVRSAVWRTGMNAVLQRHNEDGARDLDAPDEEEGVFMPHPTETEDMSRDIWEGDDFSDICAPPEDDPNERVCPRCGGHGGGYDDFPTCQVCGGSGAVTDTPTPPSPESVIQALRLPPRGIDVFNQRDILADAARELAWAWIKSKEGGPPNADGKYLRKRNALEIARAVMKETG